LPDFSNVRKCVIVALSKGEIKEVLEIVGEDKKDEVDHEVERCEWVRRAGDCEGVHLLFGEGFELGCCFVLLERRRGTKVLACVD